LQKKEGKEEKKKAFKDEGKALPFLSLLCYGLEPIMNVIASLVGLGTTRVSLFPPAPPAGFEAHPFHSRLSRE
jgi:hypothetical protein